MQHSGKIAELLQSKDADPVVAAGTGELWRFPSVAGLHFDWCTWDWDLAGAGLGSCLLLEGSKGCCAFS